eukprot:s3482_g3.t1
MATPAAHSSQWLVRAKRKVNPDVSIDPSLDLKSQDSILKVTSMPSSMARVEPSPSLAKSLPVSASSPTPLGSWSSKRGSVRSEVRSEASSQPKNLKGPGKSEHERTHERLCPESLKEIKALRGTPAKKACHGFLLGGSQEALKPKAVIEGFAGTARLSQALHKHLQERLVQENISVECYEIARSAAEDLLDEDWLRV